MPIKDDYNYFLLHKFILMQHRYCMIMWLIITDNDAISMSDGHSFSTDPLSSVNKILPTV